MSATAVPLRPIRKGSVLKLWLGLGLLVLAAAALAWFSTSGFRTVTTPSGVRIRALAQGSGAPITAQDVVALHYKLHVNSPDLPAVQDSREMGQPMVTTTEGVYPGFGEGMKQMRQGGSYVLWLPPGTFPAEPMPGAPFTPKDTLVFEIDVLQVERGRAAEFLQMQQLQRMQQLQQMQQMQGGGAEAGPPPGGPVEGGPAAPGGGAGEGAPGGR
ncbi:MAG TPA: FKBP-type peptidyl-prolyl cis-trans isomerase [Allosphingosinicella sp.]|jgi:FKBP-type peptidyl-prolyl cis-trans isomerase FkpA